MPIQYTTADAPNESGSTPVVRWLLAINIALYFLQLTVLSPADVQAQLAFRMGDLDSWWTVGTYMFVHSGFWLLALNLYTLWLFGPRVEVRWGPGQFAGYYVLCGLGAWGFYLLFAQQGVLMGASGAVMGVMLAYASRWPNEEVLLLGVLPLTVRWLVAVLVVVNILSGVGGDPGAGVAHFAHLGGLAAGWGYLRMAGSMDIDRLRQRVAAVADEPEDVPPRAIPPRSLPRQRGERERDVDEIVQQSQAAVAERSTDTSRRDSVHTAPPASSSAELNSLLDKISAKGLSALSESERTRLEDAARKLRDQ